MGCQGNADLLNTLNFLEFRYQEMHDRPGNEIGQCTKHKNDGIGNGHFSLNNGQPAGL